MSDKHNCYKCGKPDANAGYMLCPACYARPTGLDIANGELTRLRARVAAMEVALKFYADQSHYTSDSPIVFPAAMKDKGKLAKQALEGAGE